jgi:hypothetical protein
MSKTRGGLRPLCPGCGTRGETVAAATVRALLASSSECPEPDSHGFWFCTSRLCNVAYFTSSGWSADKSALTTRIGCKETLDPIPVCYCWHHTRQDIINDFRRHGRSVILERVQSLLQSGECRCETKNPTGRCCLAEMGAVLKGADKTEMDSEPAAETIQHRNNHTRFA